MSKQNVRKNIFLCMTIFIYLNYKIIVLITLKTICYAIAFYLHSIFYIYICKLQNIKKKFKHRLSMCDLTYISFYKRMLIVSLSLIIKIFLYLIFSRSDNFIFQLFAYINLMLFVYNLLPFYPLDSGKILLFVLSRYLGDINAVKIINKISRVGANVLIVIGFIQLVLYPYNIILLTLGLYIKFMNLNNYTAEYLITQFFNKSEFLKVNKKIVYIKEDNTALDIINKLKLNKMNIIILKNEQQFILISENMIKDMILNGEIDCKIKKVLKSP